MKKLQKIFIILALIVSAKAGAQQDMTIYNLQAVPQSNYSNPAIFPTPKWHIGFPGLSSVYFDAGHTGFNAHQFMSIATGDSVEINLDDLISSMGKYNYINFNSAIELLSFGFKIKDKHYINFALSNKAYMRACYPKELFEFIHQGNGAFFDETLVFDRMGINAAHYNELMLGYATEYNDKWTFGAHLKILQGLSNVYMKKSKVTLFTEEENFFITATSDIDVYASMQESIWDGDSMEFSNYMNNFSNLGIAVDLGANYRFSEKLTLGISVVDLGYIKWKTGTRNFKSVNPNGTFTFEGIDISEFLDQGDTTGANSKFDNLLDSIVDIFQIDTLNDSYSSPFNTRIYLSGSYQFTPKDQVGALLRLHFYNQAVHPAFTLGYVRKFGHILSLSATYTMAARKYFNLGVGLAANLGPVQIYATTDNIISPLVYNKYYWTEDNEQQSLTMPRNTKFLNVHFGINFVFGYKPPKENISIF